MGGREEGCRRNTAGEHVSEINKIKRVCFLIGLLRTLEVLKCAVTPTRELWDPVSPTPLVPSLICRPECKFHWIRNFSVFPPLHLQSLEGA